MSLGPPLGKRKWRVNWDLVLGLVLMSVIAVVAIALIRNWDSSDGGSEKAAEEREVEATSTPTSLLHSYSVGQLVGISAAEGSLTFCVQSDNVTKEGYPPCNLLVHAFSGDVLEIAGSAQYFSAYNQWQWPVVGRRGSKYIVGERGWISDEHQVYLLDEVPALRPPDFEVGERVKIAYNFKLRESPNGEEILGSLGLPLVIYGGNKVEILEGPVLGSDEIYWCKIVRLDYTTEESDTSYFPIAWVPCEFQRYHGAQG